MIRARTYTQRPLRTESPIRLLDPRLLVLTLALTGGSFVLLGTRSTPATSAAEATRPPQQAQQRRRPGQRRPAPRPTVRAPSVDYAKFSHATKGHYENCASCHVQNTPTKLTSDKPDVREYPDHSACLECHRQQFFRGPLRGAAPVICANCHTAAAPRNGARPAFPNPQEPTQFNDLFPHANHIKSTALAAFKNVIGPSAKQGDTCLYCHKVDKTEYKPPAGAKDAFVPAAGSFMTTPTSHATCFACHWQKGVEGRDIEPLANDCAACHQNRALAGKPTAAQPAATAPARPAATPTPKPAPAPAKPTATPAPKKPAFASAHASFIRASFGLPISFVPAASLEQQRAWPKRYATKFVHEIDAHKTRMDEEGKPQKITCLTCHPGVKAADSLATLDKPENKVQLPACSSSACHTALSGSTALPLSIYRELRERSKDAKFDCALCHTPPLSTADVPCDHYAVVYQSATKEGKSTKTLETFIPPRCSGIVPAAAPTAAPK